MEQPKNNFKIVSDKKARMLLPNALTLINVCIGLSSIKFALDEKFELSIIAIIFAAIFDALDGRVARLLKGTSLVGKELDSLADLISFGVAPAFIMYFWSLNNLGKFGWLLTMIYVVCVALRLARFNVSSNSEPSWKDNYFEGVPSPAGGILVLMPLILSMSEINLVEVSYEIVVPIFFIMISFLLISKAPTYAFKKIAIPRRMTIFALFGVVLFFGLLIVYTFKVLVICGLIYICLIPIGYFNYQKIYKQKMLSNENDENDDLEDIL
jgi:CDP-diacylglycerol--serine O-phosphatidyltransferase